MNTDCVIGHDLLLKSSVQMFAIYITVERGADLFHSIDLMVIRGTFGLYTEVRSDFESDVPGVV